MLLSEKELTVEIADFNVVVISAVHFALFAAAHSHHSEGFNVLATKGTSANHEELKVSKLLLYFATEDLNLVVVSAILGLTICFLLEVNAFKNVVVEPLLEWGVLSGELNNFLSDDTTEESALRHKGACSESSDLLNEIQVELFSLVLTFFSLIVHGFGDIGNCLPVINFGVGTVSSVEFVNGSKSDVEMVGASPEPQIRGIKHAIGVGGSGVHVALSEGVEANELGDLDVLNETLSGVQGELSGVKINLEGEGSLNVGDFDRFLVIDLGHTLNFDEF